MGRGENPSNISWTITSLSLPNGHTVRQRLHRVVAEVLEAGVCVFKNREGKRKHTTLYAGYSHFSLFWTNTTTQQESQFNSRECRPFSTRTMRSSWPSRRTSPTTSATSRRTRQMQVSERVHYLAEVLVHSRSVCPPRFKLEYKADHCRAAVLSSIVRMLECSVFWGSSLDVGSERAGAGGYSM